MLKVVSVDPAAVVVKQGFYPVPVPNMIYNPVFFTKKHLAEHFGAV